MWGMALKSVLIRPAEMVLSLQRRTKEKVVSDFSTLSKGSSVGAKPRAALRQVLFSQSQGSEKTAASEVGTRLPGRTKLLSTSTLTALRPPLSWLLRSEVSWTC